ncbi:hypothetical protein BN1708_001644 [Verticillium longisporum]|uniref:methylisocitrate lyase n=1 Tax=Verticillium longisporum TaxID=100787 RepID=A0A0G4MZ12_VERLO|nr:hypothetical protein BN1708_001644 [Verticillium longisporum]
MLIWRHPRVGHSCGKRVPLNQGISPEKAPWLASRTNSNHTMMRRIATKAPRRVPLLKPRTTPISAPSLAARCLSTTPKMAKTPANPFSDVPADAFQLLSEANKAGEAEDALYESQIKEVEAWWRSPRYEGIKRPYSAADVVSKRGTQQQTYTSSLMARKLFNLIKERGAEGKPLHTMGAIDPVTKRALAFGPYADLLWVETGDPNVEVATTLARAVRAQMPGKGLVYNLSPSFNWMAHGFTDATLKSFIWDIAREGFVLQLISLAGLHSNATITNELARDFKSDGMLAYVNLVQRREKEGGCDVLTHQKWSGASYIDGILGAIQSGSSSSKSMGEGNTEGQFN